MSYDISSVHQSLGPITAMSLDALERERASVLTNITRLVEYRLTIEQAIAAIDSLPASQMRITVVKKKETERRARYWMPGEVHAQGPKTTTVYSIALQDMSGNKVVTLRSRSGKGKESKAGMVAYLDELKQKYPGVEVDGSL